jgi:hypothetical protein
MSLTKCSGCEKEVLLDAESCQDCRGAIKYPSEEPGEGINPDDPAHIFGLMTFGVVILGVIFLLVKSCGG